MRGEERRRGVGRVREERRKAFWVAAESARVGDKEAVYVERGSVNIGEY